MSLLIDVARYSVLTCYRASYLSIDKGIALDAEIIEINAKFTKCCL